MEAAVIDKLSALFEGVAQQTAIASDGFAISLPAGVQVVRTEQFADRPRFHRHHFKTERLSDFIRYATDNASAAELDDQPATYITPDGQGVVTLFDHGGSDNPRWGHHRAELKLKQTPAWIAAQAMASGVKKQTDVIEWIEDWLLNITAHEQNGGVIAQSKAIAALRRVKLEARGDVVSVEGDFARSQSTLASIEAKGDVEALPAYFIVHTPLYIDTVESEIVMRLGVRELDGKPVLALRIVGRDTLIKTTTDWLEKTIAEAFADNPMTVYVGSISVNKPE